MAKKKVEDKPPAPPPPRRRRGLAGKFDLLVAWGFFGALVASAGVAFALAAVVLAAK